ncbi:hypothetical protein SAMN05216262_12715 [Colwellia chukchiensis]|uniref:Uncharacterized protein n=1 Tax=Colwellia chukchiensis TaxID=641665 RepID=A0A1H7TNC7_9GAMM|nr:hypothetical protein [Colwellia chukchiensis]SEL86188.1 hypothetical protein SAMN05216262_12715 [Colwellia chukchiensis]
MPSKKHKRKSSVQRRMNKVKPPGLLTKHAKLFVLVGWCFILFSIYLLAFKAHDNAMFGVAMLTLISGVVLSISAQLALNKTKQGKVKANGRSH